MNASKYDVKRSTTRVFPINISDEDYRRYMNAFNNFVKSRYELQEMTENTEMKENYLYIEWDDQKDSDVFFYTVISPKQGTIKDQINLCELNIQRPLNIKKLNSERKELLNITQKRGHTHPDTDEIMLKELQKLIRNVEKMLFWDSQFSAEKRDFVAICLIPQADQKSSVGTKSRMFQTANPKEKSEHGDKRRACIIL